MYLIRIISNGHMSASEYLAPEDYELSRKGILELYCLGLVYDKPQDLHKYVDGKWELV